ncbi:uncharacterized protein LOC103696681 [Phoenix dactylifera]|uniref:Uncharacterized protein LOC103696681 n=1 Tax=Phoenix dactylifera TaxID=42345 RepID=A0A8B7BHH3_PHODC|nr:uncharacterized protein LOC103696681 [Phoenix dactylifera]
MPKRTLVASSPGYISPKTFKHISPPKPLSLRRGPTREIAFFLLKVAALEAVRRLSRARCPFVWRAVQAFQCLCYPPFKWIQRWTPLRILVKGAQNVSSPLVFLSIATTFSDHFANCKRTSDSVDDAEAHCESPSRSSASEMRNFDESPKDTLPESWLVQLSRELEKQGITLPERIDEDELHRFYTASNGDISCLLSSLKRTIRWRETYNILSSQELETWSHLIFWHGFDVMFRPCLVIRIGLACSSLMPHNRPRFVQAIVSQIEQGVLHLVHEENPRITVLVDCEGLSPLKFPMQMMRSCSTLVQDHYPDRLGALFVMRLPPVVRVIAQTFFQVLKPTTRQKLRVEGPTYLKVLSEFLQTVPACLGGNCTCSHCRRLVAGSSLGRMEDTSRSQHHRNVSDDDAAVNGYPNTDLPMNVNCDHVLRAVIVVFLMLWILISFFAGMNDTESPSSQLS